MQIKRIFFLYVSIASVFFPLAATGYLSAQQDAPASNDQAQKSSDPLAELNSENRALFDKLQEAGKQGLDADVVATGKKLLPALKSGTRLGDYVAQVTATSAIETGEDDFALTLIKPIVDSNPADWHALAILTRIYAEKGDKAQRDEQIARLIKLHKTSSDQYFTKLHVFPIQKVKLNSGYAIFLYPFEPLTPHNVYLAAMIDMGDEKKNYRIELESLDVDQAFFKAKKLGAYSGRCGHPIPFEVGTSFCLMWAAIPL
jgi:hypothetical protein